MAKRGFSAKYFSIKNRLQGYITTRKYKKATFFRRLYGLDGICYATTIHAGNEYLQKMQVFALMVAILAKA